ncbi:MAG: hypothetical protein C0402_09830 [Thermodesulfovibrio sp.]|nr:hypothetical protein [Thermodesulfovibrio sp.]
MQNVRGMIKQEILESFSGRNVLVTGGTGLIGRQVVAILVAAGAKVRIVSLDRITLSNDAEHLFGDLTEKAFCNEVVSGMDFVFHLAGVQGSAGVAGKKLASHFVPTLMMNTNVLEACRVKRIAKVVYTSSIGAYAAAEVLRESDFSYASEPMDFAGWAKRMAELQIHAYRVQYGLENFSIVVPAHVYGPGDNFDPETAMVIPSLMHKVRSGVQPVEIWGDGSAVRDFVFSRDIAEGVVLALYYGTKAMPVNLGSGQGTSIRELAECLSSFLDFSYRFDTGKPSGAKSRVMDISLARKLLTYNPTTSLREGLQETWEWYLKNPLEHTQKVNYHLHEQA